MVDLSLPTSAKLGWIKVENLEGQKIPELRGSSFSRKRLTFGWRGGGGGGLLRYMCKSVNGYELPLHDFLEKNVGHLLHWPNKQM